MSAGAAREQDDRLVDRVGKLLAQAEGTDNEHEAAAFVERAQQLATAYAVDLERARQRQRDRQQRGTAGAAGAGAGRGRAPRAAGATATGCCSTAWWRG